jgi:hypothetical protein
MLLIVNKLGKIEIKLILKNPENNMNLFEIYI